MVFYDRNCLLVSRKKRCWLCYETFSLSTAKCTWWNSFLFKFTFANSTTTFLLYRIWAPQQAQKWKKKKKISIFLEEKKSGGGSWGSRKTNTLLFFRFLLNISYEITVSSDLIVVLTNLKQEYCSRNHLNENLFERA